MSAVGHARVLSGESGYITTHLTKTNRRAMTIPEWPAHLHHRSKLLAQPRHAVLGLNVSSILTRARGVGNPSTARSRDQLRGSQPSPHPSSLSGRLSPIACCNVDAIVSCGRDAKCAGGPIVALKRT
jgi:hypothetical protein